MRPVRIPPLQPDEITPEVRELLGPLSERDPLDNVFATFVKHAGMYPKYSRFGLFLMAKTSIPARTRELVIMRLGLLRRCEYEYAQHVQIARGVGITEDEIRALAEPVRAGEWSEIDAAAISAVDELDADNTISDETWSVLAREFDEQQLIELVFTIGCYGLITWALNTFGTPLDPFLVGHHWPETVD